MRDSELVPKILGSIANNVLEGAFPAVLARAGNEACLAADEFFSVRLSNARTQTAYARQVGRFLASCKDNSLELHQVTPGIAGGFLDEIL